MPLPNNQLVNLEIQVQGMRTSQGSTTRNFNFVFHYRRTAITPVPSETAFETVFNATITPLILAVLNNTYTQTLNVVRFLNDPQRVSQQISRAGVGAVTGDSMPSFAASYMLMRSGLRGKSYRGSKHFGPLSESDTTAGTADVLNAAALASYATLGTALLTPLVDANGNNWVLQVVSRKAPANYVVSPAIVVANDVTQIAMNKRIGKMRRREAKSVY